MNRLTAQDPERTLRDKPRRSSLPSHVLALENAARRGSISAPNSAVAPALPVARRASEAVSPVPHIPKSGSAAAEVASRKRAQTSVNNSTWTFATPHNGSALTPPDSSVKRGSWLGSSRGSRLSRRPTFQPVLETTESPVPPCTQFEALPSPRGTSVFPAGSTDPLHHPAAPTDPIDEERGPQKGARGRTEIPTEDALKSELQHPAAAATLQDRKARTNAVPLSGWQWTETPKGEAGAHSPAVPFIEPPSPTWVDPNSPVRKDDLSLTGEKSGWIDSPTTTAPVPAESTTLPWYERLPVIRTIFHHFHPKFVISIFDIRPYFWPMTFKRAAFMLAYAGIITMFVLLDHHFNWHDKVFDVLKTDAWPVMVFLICLDPVTAVYYCSIAPVYPLLPESCRPDWEHKGFYEADLADRLQAQQPEVDLEEDDLPILLDSNTADTALVIPCHDSDLPTTELVLKAALRSFRPENIFVVENGNSPLPPDYTFMNLVRDVDPRINYIWSPIGNKNVSEYVGALAAHKFTYIATVDDDVVLPANFTAPTHLITEKTKGVCYPIVAVPDRPDGSKSTFVQWQQIEYQFTGMLKAAERAHGGVIFPHGAGSFWERTTFIEVLRRVDTIFYADDLKKGMACMEIDVTLSIETQTPIETVVPFSFAGLPLPNYWTQRVRSWEMSRHTLYWKWFRCLLRWNRKQAFWTVMTHKFILFYALWANVMDWLRLPAVIIFSFKAHPFWTVSGPLLLLPIFPALILRYWKGRHRPDLRNDLFACFTMPIYKILYSIVSVAGMIRVFLTYYPNSRHVPTVKELEAREGDARPFWLDPRFKDCPGFLLLDAEKSEVIVAAP